MAKYTVGIDYGTLSARAIVCETGTGRELGEAVCAYRHAVMDEQLPDGTRLKPDWALQHPQDYVEALLVCVPKAVKASKVDPADIIGIGVDFTACTLIPVDADGVPLCEKYPSEPHAYPKLWKHHACQEQANRMTEAARARGDGLLDRFGGKMSSEWMLPKILETAEEAPAIYSETRRFMEAGDWIVMRLTGKMTRNASMAGYKALWNKERGDLPEDYLAGLSPLLKNLSTEKLGPVMPFGKAGELTAQMADRLGLAAGTAVATANIDAHVSLPPAGITETGSLLMIMGTSTCHIMLSDVNRPVPGICGVVEDGVIPGLYGYEAGQSCVGDQFNWFVENCFPAEYKREADRLGLDAHQYLTRLCAGQKPGEHGLLALDWWNGNRSVLTDVDLSGMILGMNLQTRAEDIYRALIESTAYGTRMIIENFEKHGVPVNKLYACGGIAHKNAFMMQLYADVLGREIRIARSKQTPALGAAMWGAVAAGKAKGGYGSIADAAREMGGTLDVVYRPDTENSRVYDMLYEEYSRLHDWFGRGGNDVMKRIKEIRKAAK